MTSDGTTGMSEKNEITAAVLNTVHNLHFWEREEQQILKGRHGPFFMNIYDLPKIAGLKE